MIHLYYGDGKGKTTSAMGLALRCAGNGGRVRLFQFLKDNSSCERVALENIKNIELICGRECEKFVFDMTAEENGMNLVKTSEILYVDKKRTTYLLLV